MTDPNNNALDGQAHCLCGALTDRTHRRCRKCRARSRYQHRRRNRLRHRSTLQPGRAGVGPKGR